MPTAVAAVGPHPPLCCWWWCVSCGVQVVQERYYPGDPYALRTGLDSSSGQRFAPFGVWCGVALQRSAVNEATRWIVLRCIAAAGLASESGSGKDRPLLLALEHVQSHVTSSKDSNPWAAEAATLALAQRRARAAQIDRTRASAWRVVVPADTVDFWALDIRYVASRSSVANAPSFYTERRGERRRFCGPLVAGTVGVKHRRHHGPLLCCDGAPDAGDSAHLLTVRQRRGAPSEGRDGCLRCDLRRHGLLSQVPALPHGRRVRRLPHGGLCCCGAALARSDAALYQ